MHGRIVAHRQACQLNTDSKPQDWPWMRWRRSRRGMQNGAPHEGHRQCYHFPRATPVLQGMGSGSFSARVRSNPSPRVAAHVAIPAACSSQWRTNVESEACRSGVGTRQQTATDSLVPSPALGTKGKPHRPAHSYVVTRVSRANPPPRSGRWDQQRHAGPPQPALLAQGTRHFNPPARRPARAADQGTAKSFDLLWWPV